MLKLIRMLFVPVGTAYQSELGPVFWDGYNFVNRLNIQVNPVKVVRHVH